VSRGYAEAVRDDDEIIRSYEREFDGSGSPARRSNRGFWLVAGSLVIACILLVFAILANRSLKVTIGHTEATLRDAQAAAATIREYSGSVADADATAMAGADAAHTYRSGDSVSKGLDDVSVATRAGEWGAAVQARPGACFYLHLTDAGEVFYGVGTACVGEAALAASDDRW